MAMIIGSGASSGIIAEKLVKSGIPVTILEKGPYFEPKELFEKCTEDKIYDITSDETFLIPVSNEINKINGLNIFDIDASNLSKGIEKFVEIAESKSLIINKFDKAIDGLGKEYVQAGFDYALTILNNIENIGIIAENNKIVGVKYIKDGIERTRYAKTVIITTDALDSAILLKDAGITSEGIKYNPCVTISGTIKEDLDCDLKVIAKSTKFNLYPYSTEDNILNILVESADAEEGTIDSEGNLLVNSNNSLDEGIEVAKSILEEMKAKDILIGEYRTMNPKGSAPLGSLVDDNLETNVKGLFVCDSSLSAENDVSIIPLSEKLADYLENIDYDNNQFGKSDYGLGKSYGKMDGWWREPPKE